MPGMTPDRDDRSTTGELIVLNGKQAGDRFALHLPVTVIGSSDRCDIRLSGPDVAEVHCLITFTAAGPSLRSLAPQATWLNGLATAAGMLNNGDELQVGPCRFRLDSLVEEPILLSLADSEQETGESSPQHDHQAAAEPEYFTLVPVSDEEWCLQRRKQELHEQERQLAAYLDQRHRQIVELHRQVIDAREQLRQERTEQEQALKQAWTRLRQQCAEIQPLHAAAEKARNTARQLYRRLQQRAQRLHQNQQTLLQAERARLEIERQQLQQESARQQAELAATRRRLAEAAERLAEGQRRLLADRQQSEALAAQIQQRAHQHIALAQQQQRLFETSRDRLEARVQQLLQEITRLETRATQTRAALQSLEEQRSRLLNSLAQASNPETTRVGNALGSLPEIIPLEPSSHRDPEEFLQQLQLRERELLRKERQLGEFQRELQNQFLDLADERAVFAEQVAMLTVAREQWQAAESQIVAELEEAARAVHAWEQALKLREHAAETRDRQQQEQAEELSRFRAKLEAWQSTLTVAEETAAVERDRRAAVLNVRERHLQQWEESLQKLCRDWAEAMQRDHDDLAEQRRAWAETRRTYEARFADWDRLARNRLAEATRLASIAVAVEEARAELETRSGSTGRQARRRLRVLIRRWEHHFHRFLQEFEQRHLIFSREAADCQDQHQQLQQALQELADRQQQLIEAEGRWTLEQLRQQRQLAEQQRPTLASLEESKRTQQALQILQAEIEEMAARVIGTGPQALRLIEPMPEMISLRPAA